MNMSLVMVTQDGKTKEIPISKLPLTIGRGQECKLRVPLDSVSRAHCELLENDDEELVVRDLKSSNGTYVNRERIKTRELLPGDMLAVGPVVFVVRLEGHPKDIDPVAAYGTGSVQPASAGGGGGGGVAASGSAPTVMTAPAVAKAAAPRPAPKPAPKAKDDSGDLDSILKDLSESDFDIDFGEDDDKPKAKK